MMGSEDGDDDEKPVHTVYLDSFWIDQTEVTNKMYVMCAKAGGCYPPHSTRSMSHVLYFNIPEFENFPVISVTWEQAKIYCEWVGRRLPTEAEWEKAARDTDGRTYPWGEEVDCDKANYTFGCVGDTTKVGSYSGGRSLYGVFDMAGNIEEWVSSLYLPYPYSATDGRENLSASGSRVLRGGSWSGSINDVRSANRNWLEPSKANNSIGGFRCALSE